MNRWVLVYAPGPHPYGADRGDRHPWHLKVIPGEWRSGAVFTDVGTFVHREDGQWVHSQAASIVGGVKALVFESETAALRARAEAAVA